MGTASKVFSVILRFGELCSFVIVTALLGRFFYFEDIAPNGSINGRLIYAQVISCLSILFSIVLIVPLKYSFYAWPLDALLFICTIVAFGLLANLSTSCTSTWYVTYWGWYWGRLWVPGSRVSDVGCGSWRAILAFLFMGSMAWMLSAILGAFVFLEIREGRETHRATGLKEKIQRKDHRSPDAENQQQ